MIDLRSDTVTKPCSGMLKAMQQAEVGDDVFKEDPEINRLEHRVSELFGKEAALFFPSGTMANQVAIRAWCSPGDELICDAHAHIYNYEAAGIAANSGVQARLVSSAKGVMEVSEIEPLIQADHDWLARTRLVSIENTVNRAGGTVYPLKTIEEIAQLCRRSGLGLHLDGARVFNALLAGGYNAIDLGRLVDTLSVCFSKGLGCPVGSVLVGSAEFIKQARRIRKLMGGGMRQAGYLAAACSYALDNNIQRLEEDHQHIRMLHQTLANIRHIEDLTDPITNIILFTLGNRFEPKEFTEKLRERGVLIQPFGGRRIRMVTHLDVNTQAIHKVQKALEELNNSF